MTLRKANQSLPSLASFAKWGGEGPAEDISSVPLNRVLASQLWEQQDAAVALANEHPLPLLRLTQIAAKRAAVDALRFAYDVPRLMEDATEDDRFYHRLRLILNLCLWRERLDACHKELGRRFHDSDWSGRATGRRYACDIPWPTSDTQFHLPGVSAHSALGAAMEFWLRLLSDCVLRVPSYAALIAALQDDASAVLVASPEVEKWVRDSYGQRVRVHQEFADLTYSDSERLISENATQAAHELEIALEAWRENYGEPAGGGHDSRQVLGATIKAQPFAPPPAKKTTNAEMAQRIADAAQIERKNCLSEWLVFLAEWLEEFDRPIHTWNTNPPEGVPDLPKPYWPAVADNILDITGQALQRLHAPNIPEDFALEVGDVLAAVQLAAEPVSRREGEKLMALARRDPDDGYHEKLAPLAIGFPDQLRGFARRARAIEDRSAGGGNGPAPAKGEATDAAAPQGSRSLSDKEVERHVREYIREQRENGVPIDRITRDRIDEGLKARGVAFAISRISRTNSWEALKLEKRQQRAPDPDRMKTHAPSNVDEILDAKDWEAYEKRQQEEDRNPDRYD